MSFIETRCLQLTYMSGLYKMHIFIKLFDTCLTEILYMYVIITHNNTKCNKETTCLLFLFPLLDMELSLHTCWANILPLELHP